METTTTDTKDLIVRGLCEVLKRQVKALKETERTLAEVLGVTATDYDDFGHVSDSIYEDDPYEYLKRHYDF